MKKYWFLFVPPTVFLFMMAFMPLWNVYDAKLHAIAVVQRARGEAEANEILAKTVTKDLNQFYFVKGIADKHGTIYVPTEANLPITEATNGKKTGY